MARGAMKTSPGVAVAGKLGLPHHHRMEVVIKAQLIAALVCDVPNPMSRIRILRNRQESRFARSRANFQGAGKR